MTRSSRSPVTPHSWLVRLTLWGLVVLLGLGAGPSPSPPDVARLLRTRLEAARQGAPGVLAVDQTPLRTQELVARHYQQTDFAPSWSTPRGPSAHVDSLLVVLRTADEEGLRPADYHIATIDALVRVLRTQHDLVSPERARADLDLLCTDAFFLYGSHLLHGRVDPVDLVPTWTLSRRHSDLPRELQTALRTGTLRSTLANLRPSQPEYGVLRRALTRYRTIAAQDGWPAIPDGPSLKEGMYDERVPLLRTRLRSTGDLAGHTTSSAPARFDDALRQAVGRFQERHGLRADGVVGPSTRAALNVLVKSRIRQIAINLERWRWLPRDLGNPHVLVNIADFWLRVVENDTSVLQMRVVVGTPYRKTPVFSDRISYLVFNPYWHVPARIAAEDKLPLFQRTPALFDQLGYEAFTGWGADAVQIDGATINWKTLSADDFPYRLRQKPGPVNALGRIKFMFPNAHDIYLHDTPTRWHFHRSRRDFSSGCIRVEHPIELAAYLLRHNRGWTTERIAATIDDRTERGVILQRKVPIHLLYWTAWVEKGRLHFRPDVYDRDEAVAAALSKN